MGLHAGGQAEPSGTQLDEKERPACSARNMKGIHSFPLRQY